jgi:kumamolisin
MAWASQPQTLETRHVWEAVVNGQAKVIGPMPSAQTMRLEIVLGLRHEPELKNILDELYDPASAIYRQFLTVDEFTARYGASREQYDAVVEFAKANGFRVESTSRNRMNVGVRGTVEVIEKAFHVKMNQYQHPTENRRFYAPDREPTVDLPFQLWRIAGLDNYSKPKPALTHRDTKDLTVEPNATTGSCPEQSYCGSDMRAAYYGGTTLTGAGQTLGLLEFYGTELSDLTTYYANAKQTENVPLSLVSVDGTALSCIFTYGCDDGEQTLDMTQALGMAPGLSRLVMYVGSSDAALFNGMATATPLNAQLSSSWTWKSPDPGTDDPYFEEFAAQGQTLFQAAGDSGNWNYDSGIQAYEYPSDDVYLVSVGGTDLQTQNAAGLWAAESAWANGGGGYSPLLFDIPSWQVATASGCSECSQLVRNAPDVAAEANYDFYVCSDQQGCTANYYGGTSFATPMWAAYIALANQQLAANGQPPLGFINPALYRIGLSTNYPTAFHDIMSGSNDIFGGGYPAITGFDLSTGWGSPNGSGLITALTETNFSLSASPNAVWTYQGVSATSTITVAPANGFKGSVTLSASGLPNGMTAAFSPNPATSTSTLTLTPGSSVAPGTYAVTISGLSGAVVNYATTVQIDVMADTTVTFSPTSLAFAREMVGATSKARTIMLSNTGSQVLHISSLVASGDFAISRTTCGTSLAGNRSCTLSVTFAPMQVGTRSGAIVPIGNALGTPMSVLLSGTGMAQATLIPASTTFVTTKVGSSSTAKTFTLANKTSTALTGVSISTTGDFSVSTTGTTCVTSLAANSGCTISVVFTPTTKGKQTGALQIENSAIGSPQTSSLAGTGK